MVGLALRSVMLMLFLAVFCWALVELCSFLSSLHWPSTVGDLGVGGVSFVELLILYERWAVRGWCWRCRFLSSVVSIVQFQCRLFLLDRALIFGDLAGLGAMLRALGGLLVVLVGLFLVAWVLIIVGSSLLLERCGHGLTRRPLEAAGTGFLQGCCHALRCARCGFRRSENCGFTVAVVQQGVHARCCAWTVPELRRWGFQGDFGPFFALRPQGR